MFGLKSEIRISKSETNSKWEGRGIGKQSAQPVLSALLICAFRIVSDFGFRISDLFIVMCDSRNLEQPALSGEEVLDDWAESQCGKKIKGADQEHRAEQQNNESAAGNRECSGAGRRDLLLPQRSR